MINYLVEFLRSDNKKMVASGNIGYDCDWLITATDGLAEVPIELFMGEAGIGDGSYYRSQRIALREITISAMTKTCDIDKNLTYRKNANEFFNPKYDFKIYVAVGNNKKWIDAKLSNRLIPLSFDGAPQTFEISFDAPNPYWNSMDDFGQDLAKINSMFGFPYMSALANQGVRKGIVFSAYEFQEVTNLYNDGDIETNPIIRITADADVLNPSISINGNTLEYGDTLKSGDILVIDSAKKRVTLNPQINGGQNAIRKIGLNSALTNLKLLVGNNEISYDADSGNEQMHVAVYYYKKYMGV